jgi:RHS repeat-associated protein
LYEPWGVARYQIGSNITDYAYTGQMQEGDVYFYNARWYDPHLSRFMQADTLVPTSQGTQGFDRFAYVNNNPINSSDPSGHCITCVVLAGMAIGALVDYGIQVYQNTQAGISFQEALTTDISITEIAKGTVIGGSVALIGAGVASLIGTAAVTTTAITASSVACADGDCTNEIRQLTESGLKTVEEVANSNLGRIIARQFTNNPSSNTVSIGSYPQYLQVGEGMNYTYFNMSESAWNTISKLPSHYWQGINKAFVNQQISSGKLFISALQNPRYLGEGFKLELSILRSAGYIEQVINKFSSLFRIE